MTKIRIYLAAPFFNHVQLDRVKRTELVLADFDGIEVYSPRKDGVLQDLTPQQRALEAPKCFARNVMRVRWADAMVALMDDNDEGTVWEMGRMYGTGPIIGNIGNTRTVNVMSRQSCDVITRGYDELRIALHALCTGTLSPSLQLTPNVT